VRPVILGANHLLSLTSSLGGTGTWAYVSTGFSPPSSLASLNPMPVFPATPETIAEAGQFLAQAGIVAFPTETVYGLGADATNDLAVAAVFSAKKRPVFNPLIVHVPAVVIAERYAKFDARARALAAAFWPGPFSMVLPRHPDCVLSQLTTAGLDTVAIRIPAHPVAHALMVAARKPIAAPSANRSGHVSPTTAEHVAADLGDVLHMIIDGGATEVGLESTVVDATGANVIVLRPGAVTAQEIEAVIGARVHHAMGDIGEKPSSPGQLLSHYAPRARVRLHATGLDLRETEGLLAFGPTAALGPRVVNLSTSGNVLEAAANLFSGLRRLDAMGVETIAVMPIPDVGLGLAINDRLLRAAAHR
jgi:L-threonylcarbamoyladenylate synthase